MKLAGYCWAKAFAVSSGSFSYCAKYGRMLNSDWAVGSPYTFQVAPASRNASGIVFHENLAVSVGLVCTSVVSNGPLVLPTPTLLDMSIRRLGSVGPITEQK